MNALQREKIHLVRRYSGGGTVYQDFGNVNWTLVLDRKTFSLDTGPLVMCAFLRNAFGLNASVGKRREILLDTFKVSGTAFKLTNERAYCHGTLLIWSDLQLLKSLLTKTLLPNGLEILSSLGIPSVPSKVGNLVHFCDASNCPLPLSIEESYEWICNAMERHFDMPIALVDSSIREECLEEAAMLRSYEWVYGKTPSFKTKRQPFGTTDTNT